MGDPEIFFSHIFWQNLLPGNVKQSQSLLQTFQKAVETLPPLCYLNQTDPVLDRANTRPMISPIWLHGQGWA